MSPLPAYGFEEKVQLGIEEAYCTDNVAATPGGDIRVVNEFKPENWGVTITDEAMQNTPSPGSSVRFHYGDATAPCPTEFKEIPDVSGSFEFNLGMDTIGWFLANAVFTADSITNTQDAANNAYEHTFEFPTASPNEMPDSLFMRRVFGEGVVDHRGGMCDTLMIVGEANQLVRVDAGLVFSIYDNYFDNDEPPLVVPSACPVSAYLNDTKLFWSPDPLGTPTPLAAKGNVQNWTFGIENNLRRIPAAGFGKRGHRKPIPDGFRRIYLEFATDAEGFGDSTRWSRMWDDIGDTGYGSLRMEIDTGILIDDPGSTWTYKMDIELDCVRVLGDATTHPGSEGPVPETIRMEAAVITDSGTDKMGRIILRNGVDEDSWQSNT